ncbi:DNA/RNA non-specific endonuclease [Lapidilactobacillus luobeiensis]|uniref:DNA/RNA non-specific endonuclease n=1 Tax=Lapidilactobacillus luobeiensis TaxID=2950371 RepID=UPI0021C32EEB|nr:DNA/RNA non-specific endonuclease [Lapidilactobacillus luobeiensis]
MAKRRRRKQTKTKLTSLIAVLIIAGLVWLAQDPSKFLNNSGGTSPQSSQVSQSSAGSLASGSSQALTNSQVEAEAPASSGSEKTSQNIVQADQLSGLTYRDKQIIAVNQNRPTFSKSELSLSRGAWQSFTNLDQNNRVGVANAMLQQSLMPTTKRERLYIQPTGWHNRKITINGHSDYLYNRCHLIGYQLTGENNNAKNLMTGTRSLNDPAMTYYENAVAAYLKETGHHVRYQVTPIFVGSELVARGIHLMGQSIEDGQVAFNIYIFNVQANYQINYQTGTSKAA